MSDLTELDADNAVARIGEPADWLRYHRVHCAGCQECRGRLTLRDIEEARDKMWATPHRGDTMLDRWADDGGPTSDEAEAVADEAERDRPEREEGTDGS